MLVYKKGSEADFNGFYLLFSSSLKEQFSHYSANIIAFFLEVDYKKDWLRDQIKSEKRWIFLAYDEKEVVGYLFSGKVYGGVSTAYWMAVKPTHQKKGIASNLLQLWENFAKSKSAHSLFLWTSKNNLKFYENRKFFKIGHYPKGWFGNDSYCFYRQISEHTEAYLED